MITLDVVQDGGTPIAAQISGLASQLPYALSVALNLTANAAQSAVKATLPSEFTLRRASFIENTIYRKPGQDFATKTNLVAAVRVNPGRDFLAKFEVGGEKRSLSGHALAVPIVRIGAPNLIIGRNDPRSIHRVMALIAEQGGKAVGPFKKRTATRAARQSFFILRTRHGNTLVMQRDGANVGVLYAFKKQVPIKPDLHFDETAMAAALASWDANFAAALDRAIATMR